MKEPQGMSQLFLCYRRAGAQTAKLFSFYMKRNHPEIRVWYSDSEREGNFTLDIPELMKKSYGAVVFVSKGFTKGFLDREGRINANAYRAEQAEECVTVQEIIEIERNLQERKDFELHMVHLDGALLDKRDQMVLEAVFGQAGILRKDSVAHFAQRNHNAFDTARDHEELFFDRMIGAYLPSNTHLAIRGNYSVGGYTTTVDVLCWDCRQFIRPEHISFELENEDIPLYDRIERAPIQEEPLQQDDDVLSVVRFDQDLTTNEERKHLRIGCRISKYHLFKKTLDLWDRNGFGMSAEIARYLNGEEETRRYPIPNAMGLALMVVTADGKLVFSRRSGKRRVRSREFDCSIVEGLLPAVDKEIGGVRARYDYTSPDYIARECKRAFFEEICADQRLQASVFGLILDRKYGQWNLTGMIRSSLSARQIQALHPTREDTTEANRLYFVDCLAPDGTKSIRAVRDALQLYRKDGFWDTALAALTGTLCSLGFAQEEIDALCE